MIYIFLPAYNEEIAIPILIKKFDKVLRSANEDYEILLFDDGSSDKTREVAIDLSKSYPIKVMHHEKNEGLGQTLIDGFSHLSMNIENHDEIVTLDCDDTHEPQYLMEALRKLRSGLDMVILSRYAAGGGQEGLSGIKSLMSMGAGVFLKIFFPIKGVREYSCNYRIYTGTIVKKAHEVFGAKLIQLQEMGFAAAPEMLIKMRMLKARIGESPFTLKYHQKPTRSTNNSMRTIMGYFKMVYLYFGRKIQNTK